MDVERHPVIVEIAITELQISAADKILFALSMDQSPVLLIFLIYFFSKLSVSFKLPVL
jgi:hypothetical protein